MASAVPPAHRPANEGAGFVVVGIGASAGGLDACRGLLAALPEHTGMAFILVQHLDPSHQSMLVDLLARGTSLTVLQATEGMPVERDHLYVIPPGTYISVGDGALHVSQPLARHGARLPFDFLLRSLAAEYGPRAACVILSGTGSDGSLGLQAVKQHGGLVVAQDPDEAGYDGMPRGAMMTGDVDLVLPVAEIPDALLGHDRTAAIGHARGASSGPVADTEHLPEILDLLRTRTVHDFTHYKEGTLLRRIARRMGIAGIETTDTGRYVELLRNDQAELDLLAKDLLIHVTSFFRDPDVFDFLEREIVPGLVRGKPPGHPLRIWIAGCSTGEETYSLAMLFLEQISAMKRDVRLQVFASDVDPDAVAHAREGLYPATIEADVPPGRLARFFTKEGGGYRISSDLRTAVVFTVQDLLGDPPFSRLDLVSCRNLLIYLRPEAQAKVIALLDFALRDRGILLLGTSETVGNADGRFEDIAKPQRIYRHVGRGRPRGLGFPVGADDGRLVTGRPAHERLPPTRQAALADLCQRLVMESFAPAAVLVNGRNECLYSLGPTDRYLHVPPGHPTHDLLAMASQETRTKLRSALRRASQEKTRIVVSGGQAHRDGRLVPFDVAVQPVQSDGEDLLLICFLDTPARERKRDRPLLPHESSRVAELERELEATRTELRGAIHDLEVSNQELKETNQEALSAQEEYQTTNEELLTSKEELQSLNEELTALNSQLQETLEHQRTTSNDLQNVLYSTDIATIFLDPDLNIRLFTPATTQLFRVIASDVGRPLADFASLAADGALLDDARTVLRTSVPIEREIEARSGSWYIRRAMPYRTRDGRIEGVVITFTDVTERRRAADALATAQRQAELANAAKSRFLSAASHDLRQPLQTLVLLGGMLAKVVEGERARNLVSRLDETLAAMSGMLNALLDVNQIEAGTIRPTLSTFRIDELLDRLRSEFGYHAQAKGLILRAVPCSLSIRSDPRLLEQMLRNLLTNALKYTSSGKVLLGCRRRPGLLSVEVWDTGLGIPKAELQAIFEEYYQIDNAAREPSRGLGLGLSIVRRLGNLLGHGVKVRSRAGRGSAFAIEIALRAGETTPGRTQPGGDGDGTDREDARPDEDLRRSGEILVVEDEPEVLALVKMLLEGEGHHVATAADGAGALELVAHGMARPDLILADYNLPNGLNGLELCARLRDILRRKVPIVILTGDISTATLRDIAQQDCTQLNKPVRPVVLARAIRQLLATPQATEPPGGKHAAEAPEQHGKKEERVVFVVDDDGHVRAALAETLGAAGYPVREYPSGEEFLDDDRRDPGACLIVDAYLPGISGMKVLQRLRDTGERLPAIMITGSGDVAMAVKAMKAGAADFLEKPIAAGELLASVGRAIEHSKDEGKAAAAREEAASRLAPLTDRQRQILELVLAGHPSKNIAADLGISQRTVENHRAAIMKRTGSRSLPALARLAVAAATDVHQEPLDAPPPVSPASAACR